MILYPSHTHTHPAPRNGEIVLMMLTSAGDEYDLRDGKELRRLALGLGIPTVTTVAGCRATAMALQAMRRGPLVQVRIQEGRGYVRDGRGHSHVSRLHGISKITPPVTYNLY